MYMVRFEGEFDLDIDKVVTESIPFEKINKLIIGSNNGQFYSEVYSNASNEADAIDTTSKYLEEVTSLMLYETDYEVKRLDWKQINEIDKRAEPVKTRARHENEDLKATVRVKKHFKSQEIKDKIENMPAGSINDYTRIFIEVSKLKDPISKFTLYYSLLSVLKGNQKKVDKFIESVDKDVIKRETTRKNKKFKETIYTYLRNQVGHVQEDTDTDTLKCEIQNNIGRLREILKRALEEF